MKTHRRITIKDPAPNRGINSPAAWKRVKEPLRSAVLAWIRDSLEPADTVVSGTSYGIKHVFASQAAQGSGLCSGHFYLTNGEFKGAMLEAGLKPVDRTTLNWEFYARFKPARARRRTEDYHDWYRRPWTPAAPTIAAMAGA